MAGDEIDNERKETITMAEFSDDEKRVLGETLAEMVRTMASHKLTLARLVKNQEAQQKTLVDLAEMVNQHEVLIADVRAKFAQLLGKPGDPGSVN
jgi:hypothetical protein